MPSRVIRVAPIRRPGWPSRMMRWGVSVAFLLAAVLWTLSYFVSVTYSCPTSNVVPATWQGQSITWTVFRFSGIDSGALLIWFPTWHPSNIPPPKTWDFTGFVLSFPRPAFIWPTYLGSYASAGSIGAFVIPLWFPSALFGILAALLWRGEIRHRKSARPNYVTVLRERPGRALPRAASLVMFLSALVLPTAILEGIDRQVGGSFSEWLDVAMRFQDTMWLSTLMFVSLSLAFVAAVWAFRKACWRTRYVPSHLCLACEYNLTGNVSGICPECGTPVAARA